MAALLENTRVEVESVNCSLIESIEDAKIEAELVNSGLTQSELEDAKIASKLADAKAIAEQEDAKIAAELASSEIEAYDQLDVEISEIDAASAKVEPSAKSTAPPKLTEKQLRIQNTIQAEIDFIQMDKDFVEDGLSLDQKQFLPEVVAQIIELYTEILSQLNDRLKKPTSKTVHIHFTAEMLQCIGIAALFDNILKTYYDADSVVLLPGSQKSLVDFVTMGTDVIIMRIDYDSFFKTIEFEGTSIDRYIEDCRENATKTMGRQLSPSAAKCRYLHMEKLPLIIRATACFIRNKIGAACDDVFTGKLQLELSNRLGAIYDSGIVKKAFLTIRSSTIIEEAAIEYASAISAKSVKTPAAQENDTSFAQIAKISRDLCVSSKKSPPRPKELPNVELFNMANYNGNTLCASCNVRTASTNMNPQNGRIGESLFPICDDKNHFIGGLCQMCAYCVSNNNSWKTIVPMSTALIKGFFPFANKSFEAKKIAIYEMRKAHLNCNRCNAVNGRVFHSRTNELKFGVYCLDCVTEVYRGMHGCHPSPRMENQELFEDFTFNQKEYLEALSARA
jgi:hypothetical protein